jgi:hypothetical protein
VFNFPKMRPFAKGILSFIFPNLRAVHKHTNPLGTLSAESCYSIFLRHISFLRKAGVQTVPKVLAEFGPGSSLGTGFAALIAGAEKYYALDLIDFSETTSNLTVFDELVALFRRKAPIPASGVHSLRFPDLDCYDFPDFLALDLDAAFEKRIAAIRQDIALKAGVFVQIAAPWMQRSILRPSSVDWIFSQSVMEHIDDIAGAYGTFAYLLKPSGYASHLIDFGCHGLTQEWNGHWALNESTWFVLRGRRPYLINRLPYSEHIRLATANRFVTVLEKRNKRFDGLIPEQFAPCFRSMSDEDARTRMALLVNRLEM